MPATRSAIISIFIISCLFSLVLITLYLNYGSVVCHEGSFLCSKSDVCIANKYKCNNFADCLHGEDEDPLMCADLYGGLQYFRKVIDVNWTKIAGMKKKNHIPIPCVLRGYPAKCDCNDTLLRCREIGLTEVPRNVSQNVQVMSMKMNEIVLSNDSLDGYYLLKTLQLERNRLSRIPPFVFKHQNKLQWLLLLDNNLRVLEKNAFYGLNNVKSIFLEKNNLEYLNLNSWKHMTDLVWLDLSHNLLTFKNECFPYLSNLTVLNLTCNRIETISESLFTNLPNLRKLDLRYNVITVIYKNAFQNLLELVELQINNNQITTITQEILRPLKSLTKLSLGNNPIARINGDIFIDMKNLSSLDMNGIDKENIEMILFDNLIELKFLYLKEFHYCVLYAKHVDVCYPNTDGLSSSLNLLSKPIFHWFLWTVTVFTLVMNVLVLYGRMFSALRDENQAINFVIRNLAVADLLMVIYLTVIGYHDKVYQNQYYLYAHEWESSNLCTAIGITAVISSEVSMLILVFLSLERFLLIAVPFSGYQVLKLKTAVYCMISIWSIAIIISITPLILWKHSSKFYGSNGLCYPLYIEDPFVIGWQYSAFIYLGLHTTSLLLMSVLYTLMFLSVRETRQAARISAGDFDFAVRFFFIVLANCLCWLPIIVLKFAALRKFHISSKMYGWVIVFVVPINALVNPLLYTFTTPKYRNAITSTNILKMLHRDSSSGAEMSTSYTVTLFGRTIMKNGRKPVEKAKDKSSMQENSFESTNGE